MRKSMIPEKIMLNGSSSNPAAGRGQGARMMPERMDAIRIHEDHGRIAGC